MIWEVFITSLFYFFKYILYLRNIVLCDILNKELANFYKKGDTIFFAPMGMGVFDISIADYFYRQAVENMRGMHLN